MYRMSNPFFMQCTKIFQQRFQALCDESLKKRAVLMREIPLNRSEYNALYYKPTVPTLSALCRICDYFQVESDWLLGLMPE